MSLDLKNGIRNKVLKDDRAVHDWYRFVLSFPPHLVRKYLEKFAIAPDETVLDPFSGTGTTLVECKKLGINAVGIEANSMAFFASTVKTDWNIRPRQIIDAAREIGDVVCEAYRAEGLVDDPDFFTSTPAQANDHLRTLNDERASLILKNSISPLPLHKVLVLIDEIERRKRLRAYPYLRLALANAVVFSISNLHFGPEVGVTKPKSDVPVISEWQQRCHDMARDLDSLADIEAGRTSVHHADARDSTKLIPPKSVNAVITSPPYPNEKDYTRTTRLESVLLGFISTKSELRELKKQLVRSNTRGVYRADDDDVHVEKNERIQEIARQIEERRITLGKTSGFERMYHRVAKLYFGGMVRHLRSLQPVLADGAQLAYVVGDQASYLRVMIRTGEILAELAEEIGYEVIDIDLFRTRIATATKAQLREEVVLLRWKG